MFKEKNFFQCEEEHFATLHVYPPTARLAHQHAVTLLRVAASNLSPSPPLTPSLLLPHHPLPLPSHLSSLSTPLMLCWRVACCVCQLVNARCTAADKDQKDLTNNRLLTGERDTQVPPRKPPPQLTWPPPPHTFHPPTCSFPSPAAKFPRPHRATPQQDTDTALFHIIICNWIRSQRKSFWVVGLPECWQATHYKLRVLFI